MPKDPALYLPPIRLKAYSTPHFCIHSGISALFFIFIYLPFDHDTSTRLISLYIENERLYQKHIECLILKLQDAINAGKMIIADNENLKLQMQILKGKVDGDCP